MGPTRSACGLGCPWAVVRSLAPIALGHAAAIGVVLALASAVRIVLPLQTLKYAVAAGLVALGIYRLVRHRHFKWVGMQVGFRDLTLWSFLMASAHGAGLMVLPVVMGMPAGGGHHMHTAGVTDPLTGAEATLVHSLGYLTLTEKTYAALFLFAHATLFVYVVIVGTTNYLRMARSHSAVIEGLAPEAPVGLRKLGILQREPTLVAMAWGSLYLLVHGGFLVIVHLVNWPT